MPDDVARMHRLDVECFTQPFRFDLRSMRRFATGRRSIVRLAESEPGDLAGFVIVELTGRALAYVVTLDVGEKYRRQGLARKLLHAASEAAASAGAVAMVLHVYAGNAGAIGFYAAERFESAERVEGFYGPGLDAWVYRRALAIQAD